MFFIFLFLFINLFSSPLAQSHEYTLETSWSEKNQIDHFILQKADDSEIQRLHLTLSYFDKIVQLKVKDATQKRWEIPERSPFPSLTNYQLIDKETSDCLVHVYSQPFSLVIQRKDNRQIIFDTRGKKFVYSDLYIELTTSVPTNQIYGFGERYYKFTMTPGTYTIWPRDDPMIMEDGSTGHNTYSHQPIGLFRDAEKSFFLTYMRNSNAMDIIINEGSLTYKMVGGIIDLIFFIGDQNPETAIQSYHEFLGGFTMMPFWAMGFHQSKWGYQSSAQLRDVISKYNENDIPLDTIWTDLDYMKGREVFTVDEQRFPSSEMKDLKGKRWVPIIDPGVKVGGEAANIGTNMDIFIKNYQNRNLVGSVWPGHVYFPDFWHPQCANYWDMMLQKLYDVVPYAGIWLDMNEIANFVHGEEGNRPPNKYDNLPYTPGGRSLKTKTVSLDALHHGGGIEYNVHSLYSALQAEATYKALSKRTPMPFILTRASSPGVGRYSAHWTGDNGATWDYLKISLAGNFNFQIFGMPFVGADICGFMGNTNDELCSRWIQVGALYPFARNHHEINTRSQEPWTFPGGTVLETTQVSLKMRYSLLSWYYSIFLLSKGKGTIFRPVWFEFYDDENLYLDQFQDQQFLIGNSLMCTPQLSQGQSTVNAYFPQTRWFDFITGKTIITEKQNERIVQIKTPLKETAPLFIREGHIIPRQDTTNVLSTNDLDNQYQLTIALKNQGSLYEAEGHLIGLQTLTDSQISTRCIDNDCLYTIKAQIQILNNKQALVAIRFDTTQRLDTIKVTQLRLYGLDQFTPTYTDENYQLSREDSSILSITCIHPLEIDNQSEFRFSLFSDVGF